MARADHPYLNVDGTECCGGYAWRGHLCSYHEGLEDALEVVADDDLLAEVLRRGLLHDTEWSCHFSPDGRRYISFHDKNSVHMNGCIPVYALRSLPNAPK